MAALEKSLVLLSFVEAGQYSMKKNKEHSGEFCNYDSEGAQQICTCGSDSIDSVQQLLRYPVLEYKCTNSYGAQFILGPRSENENRDYKHDNRYYKQRWQESKLQPLPFQAGAMARATLEP